jgi:hypothetical protein
VNASLSFGPESFLSCSEAFAIYPFYLMATKIVRDVKEDEKNKNDFENVLSCALPNDTK